MLGHARTYAARTHHLPTTARVHTQTHTFRRHSPRQTRVCPANVCRAGAGSATSPTDSRLGVCLRCDEGADNLKPSGSLSVQRAESVCSCALHDSTLKMERAPAGGYAPSESASRSPEARPGAFCVRTLPSVHMLVGR
jgi:hypothetical protein